MISVASPVAALRVVTVSADESLLSELRDTLEENGHRILREGRSGEDLVRCALALEPDVLILGMEHGVTWGLEGLQSIYKERPVAVVAIIEEEEQNEILRHLDQFCLSYLLRPLEPRQLVPAMHVAAARFKAFQQLAEENAMLRQTLQNRKLIERAKGILMQRHRLSEPDAFQKLQRGAMNRRTTMADLASALVNGRNVEL